MNPRIRLAAQVLLLMIALLAAAMLADVLRNESPFFKRYPIEATTSFLGSIIGSIIALRWIFPPGTYLQRSYSFSWNMLGLLVALASGGIGLLIGRAIKALIALTGQST